MAPDQARNFINLPSEIRAEIYDLSFPIRRLVAQDIPDPEWAWNTPEGRTVPSLLFVNKKIYAQAVTIFYSKAILEVAPINPPDYHFDIVHRSMRTIDLAAAFNRVLAFCPSHLLRCIQKVEIFSGQSFAVNAEAYEALLRWLIHNTAVTEIYLSKRLLTRLRKVRTDIDYAIGLMTKCSSSRPWRSVHIFTRHVDRTAWDRTKYRQLTDALKGRRLPAIQFYMIEKDSTHDPVLDPRWDVRNSDNEDHFEKIDVLASWLESLALKDEQSNKWKRIPSSTSIHKERLLQICFVFTLP